MSRAEHSPFVMVARTCCALYCVTLIELPCLSLSARPRQYATRLFPVNNSMSCKRDSPLHGVVSTDTFSIDWAPSIPLGWRTLLIASSKSSEQSARERRTTSANFAQSLQFAYSKSIQVEDLSLTVRLWIWDKTLSAILKPTCCCSDRVLLSPAGAPLKRWWNITRDSDDLGARLGVATLWETCCPRCVRNDKSAFVGLQQIRWYVSQHS